ncbi:MAG: glycosyltransferase [Sphingomonadales bacterium]|jgi:cellulose synthase/poly-beta-1,6-N-acetylglucosamine synthase-like glycosyltransferase/peptidoglycan/xylan/chitin deacetylase (PgdA/CDA1 family)/spore germination protein YaaH
MNMPVFFDPTGRRHRQARRAGLLALALVVLISAIFATTVVAVPPAPPLPLGFERNAPLPLKVQVGRLSNRLGGLVGGLFDSKAERAPVGPHAGLTIGFYTPWSMDGAASLTRNLGQIDWVAPTLFSLDHTGKLTVNDDAPMRQVLAGALRRPLVLPVLQNAANGSWDGTGTAAALATASSRARIIASITRALDRSGDAGVIIDFENMPAGSLRLLHRFAGELHAALAPRHRLLAITMPIDDPAWSARAFSDVVDRVVLMAYDEHWQGGTPGPIASNHWFAQQLARAARGVPADRLVVALGNYAYDWHHGQADAATVEEAWLAAHDSGAQPVWDKASGNIGFAFAAQDEGGARHDVWLLDAASAWNQMKIVRRLGLANVALWRVGSEDPGFWPALKAWRQGSIRPPALSRVEESSNVDVEGRGEILRVTAQPQPGTRRISLDALTGLIGDEVYGQLPTPYVVQRTGGRPRHVALTFDDGPDPVWTPKILSVLEHYHVPGTFFVIGENGVQNREILQRIVAGGSEIGNHSYTHPNMADESDTGIRLELNATQRLIEAYTGRSTRLFRAPYFGDAEPTTADELEPAVLAQQQGYTVVGLHADPGDWKRRSADEIVARTIAAVESDSPQRSENIVLLHDGGGNRTTTVAALPRIIERLQADGYTLVPVSALAGLSRDTVMPRVTGWDLLAVRADVGLFTLLAGTEKALNWVFFFAIALGVLRAVSLTLLAALPPRAEDRPPARQNGPQPKVTVIIPAYNEERVIEASVQRILASDYPHMDVIVADDGSKDRTSAIVAAAFGADPRVRLLTMVNGGKANALNRALAVADGEIIVALDADTHFETATISKLVRWFADPGIGAVAGNAKVGNRVNLVTRWQAVEYATAQNIERRALTRFDAIMVVPGAVGAWRRAALNDVGGYPEDTLAEDQDLTIAIQRKGWSVAYDEEAVAWTEAPETLAALGKQRFRWAFGTLQCLWKHRSILRSRRPAGLALVGFPQAWAFQILFAMISPLIDLALAVSIIGTAWNIVDHGWAQTQTDVLRMGAYWLAFTIVDLICGLIAFRLDVRERRLPALLLLSQRFVYRQLMYGVVIRAVGAALAGLGIGWGKLERSGRVSAPASAAV